MSKMALRIIANTYDHGGFILSYENIYTTSKFNYDNVLNAVLEDNVTITSKFIPEKLNGVVQLEADAKSAHRDEQNEVIMENKHLTAIPCYAWANRGEGEMAVWIPRTRNSIRPLPLSKISTQAKVTASSPNKSLNSVNDGYWPYNSNDRDALFYNLWQKKTTQKNGLNMSLKDLKHIHIHWYIGMMMVLEVDVEFLYHGTFNIRMRMEIGKM